MNPISRVRLGDERGERTGLHDSEANGHRIAHVISRDRAMGDNHAASKGHDGDHQRQMAALSAQERRGFAQHASGTTQDLLRVSR